MSSRNRNSGPLWYVFCCSGFHPWGSYDVWCWCIGHNCYLSTLLAMLCVEFKILSYLHCQIKSSLLTSWHLVFFINSEPMVEETDYRGTRVLLCLFVLVILNQCCEVSCCTPAFLTIEHLTIGEGFTFDSFSFVSFTLAFKLFYSSWHTVAAVKPGWKKNIERPSLSGRV